MNDGFIRLFNRSSSLSLGILSIEPNFSDKNLPPPVAKNSVSVSSLGTNIARLVNYHREGKVVYYGLDDQHIQQIFDQGYLHIQER